MGEAGQQGPVKTLPGGRPSQASKSGLAAGTQSSGYDTGLSGTT